MLRIYACIAHEHDIRLVLVAGVICFLAAMTAFAAFGQARAGRKRRGAWLGLAGLVSGVGIWATHFLAMLAFDPGVPIGYDVPMTFLSVAVAVAVCACGWRVALMPHPIAPWTGGVIIAAGVAAMHHLGMAAMIVAGRLVWDPILLFASLAAGALLAPPALALHVRGRSRVLPPLLLTLAVCSVHFIAMAAADLYPDSEIVVPPQAVGSTALAVGVAAAALLLLGAGFGLVLFDRQVARAKLREKQVHHMLIGRRGLCDVRIPNAATGPVRTNLTLA